jgi:hypothetical protein
MLDADIYIHISQDGLAFYYTVRNSDRLIDSGRVDTQETVAPGYYGGSEAMD